MRSPTDASVPTKRPDLATVEADGQWHLHYPGLPDTICLNVSAQAILDLCDGERTVGQICSQLADECDYPVGVLASDVKVTLAQLEKFGVVKIQKPVPTGQASATTLGD